MEDACRARPNTSKPGPRFAELHGTLILVFIGRIGTEVNQDSVLRIFLASTVSALPLPFKRANQTKLLYKRFTARPIPNVFLILHRLHIVDLVFFSLVTLWGVAD